MRRSGDTTGSNRPTLEDLAALVRGAREALVDPDTGRRNVSIKAAAGIGGMSHMTWQRIEHAEPVRGLSYGGVETALGWAPGSVARYLETGEHPREDASGAPAAAAAVPSLLDATHDELLAELRRRLYHLVPSTPVLDQRPHLAEADSVETAESVERRGGRAGFLLEAEGDSGTGTERATQ